MATGDEIRAAREKMGLSQEQLADAIGISQPAIMKIESGKTSRSRFMPELERFLGIVRPPASASQYRPPPQLFTGNDLPVFSAAEGGPGEMVVSTDPIEFVPRPWFLKSIKEGYAVIVTGESMVPVYEPGDMVIVNPRLPAIKGRNAIFVGGEEHGEFKATVKRLERSTPSEWHVRQWNPPEGAKPEFTLSKKQWPRALRIVGKYEGT